MVQVLRTMTEVATSETLVHLAEIVRISLDDTKFFWDSVEESSKLLHFVDLASERTPPTSPSIIIDCLF
jgi:E3 ubiquitin-protein ligase HUWE1